MKSRITPGNNPLPAAAPPARSPVRSSFRQKAVAHQRGGMKLAYVGILFFILVYFARPNDWIPGMAFFPFAKIAGVVALAGFLFSLLQQPQGVLSLPTEIRLVLFLFVHLLLTIPFSTWRGGSFNVVVEGFSKVVLIALCLSLIVTTLPRLRLLVFLQTGAVVVMAFLVAAGKGTVTVAAAGELVRIGGFGALANPNEFAFACSLVFPFAIAFVLGTRNILLKLLWALGAVAMAYGVILSLSRGGLLALVAGTIFVLWEFGVRGRRPHLVLITLVLAVGLLLASPGGFGRRVESMFDASKDETGSSWARWTLLYKARDAALKNPIFGLGPGNFQALEGTFWHGAHNTYALLAAEAGFPALILFLLILYKSFQNLRRTIEVSKSSPKTLLLAGALRANLACYVIGAFFGDSAYHFFPYLLVGYISALHRIVMASEATEVSARQAVEGTPGSQEGGNGREHQLAWTAR